ncbi:hypothetical protein MBUL_03154 [Methylobacterium bullatum]|uniref:Histidine kinase n=1 Tax=Methylobacterium bullatum TaxID=570505 RepID=A0A679J9V5_9HYPH|nr:hypothetical protein MBUL_03154 [Methylobacterium bullatum]
MRQAVHAQGPVIVRQTVRALDHGITVRSVDGIGSLFSVTVPCADRPDDGAPRCRGEAREGRWTRLS